MIKVQVDTKQEGLETQAAGSRKENKVGVKKISKEVWKLKQLVPEKIG